MSFLDTIEKARAYLERQGRVSLRVLRLEFELDDARLEALVEELVDVQRVAVRGDGVLVAAAPKDPASSAPQTPGGAPTARDHTPKHLADKILQSKSALEGERKQVSVLFADVKGSMDLAERLDPEEWSAIMQRFFKTLADGISRFEGFVDKFTGDGIMALFGAPIAHEDHAQRACYAALELRTRLAAQARDVKRTHGLQLSVRMGIHSGEVVVGKIGDDLRMDYTAQGHTVGLAARLEALASPDTIYVSRQTAALVSGLCEVEDLGDFTVKGVTEPVRVFELRGLGPLRTRFDVSRARGLSHFVGRDADMRTLEDALEEARKGNGQVVGVVAEAGTGKSRLCFEFAERCRARGIGVYQGQAVAHGKNIPLLPMLQVFRAYLGIADNDDARTIREKIAGRLLLMDPALADELPIAFEFMGVPDPARPAPEMAPEARQRRLFALLRRTFRNDAESGVTLIEDLHWLDGASEVFIEQCVEAVADTRVLLLLNFRPEYRADWMGVPYYHSIELAPLGPEAIRELLDHLLGTDPSTAGLARKIHERTAGNPLFAEEVVHMLAESGQLEGRRGAYRLTTALERLTMPDTVHALLAARIDRLEERAKNVLQTGAVIGAEFREALLARVAELPRAQLEAALSELSQADLIHQTALYPSAEYAFKHALKHEVALDMQLHERRRRTHAAVARAIAEESPDRLDESAALIAHHWEAAGETLEAARWHRRSAEWISSDDPLKAVQHWQKVRELADTLDASDETDRLHLDACSFIVRWCWRTGYENFDALFAEGETLARRLHDDSAVVSLQLGRGPYHASRGEFAAAVEATRRAVELAERAGDELHLRNARWQHCYYLWTTGAVHDAHDGLEAIVEREEVGLDILFSGNSEWLMSAMLLSQIKMWLGDMESAVALNARTIQIARRSDRKEELGWVLGACAALAVLRGEHRNSEAPDLDRAMVEALEIAETLGSSFSRAISMYDLTLSHIVAERWTEAIDSGRRALRMAREERAGTESIVTTLCWLVTATLRTGDADGAHELAEEALRTSERFGARLGQAQAHLQLASVELERLGPRARAEIGRHLERSREIAGSLGARALLPQIRETEARLEARDGNGEQAGTMLRDALALYEEVGATGHAARLRRELGSRTDFSR